MQEGDMQICTDALFSVNRAESFDQSFAEGRWRESLWNIPWFADFPFSADDAKDLADLEWLEPPKTLIEIK